MPMNVQYQNLIRAYARPILALIGMVLVACVLALDIGYAAEGWDDWPEEGNGSQVLTDERMNVFLGSSNIYVKLGAAAVAGILVYILFLFVFKSLIKKERPPAKVFTVTFSLLLISWYVVLFFCFSEYTVIQAYAPDISVRDYFGKLNLQLVLFSFVGWAVVSLILSTLMRGNTASNS